MVGMMLEMMMVGHGYGRVEVTGNRNTKEMKKRRRGKWQQIARFLVIFRER